jgi:hypothetical protein
MTAVSPRDARYYYIDLPSGDVLGYSLKVGASTIHKVWMGTDKRNPQRPRMGGCEAQAARRAGRDVHLFVRHPLDRLVSCWRYFRDYHNSWIVKEMTDEHNRMFLGKDEHKQIGLEDWWRVASQYENGHWDSQTWSHSWNGELTPNKLYPLEAMKLATDVHENATQRKKGWEEYYTPTFRDEIETYYSDDIALYTRAKGEWNGQAPSLLFST